MKQNNIAAITSNTWYDEKTSGAYLGKACGLAARYKSETGDGWESAPAAFVEWLAGLKPFISPATWRQYKAACVCLLKASGPVEAVELLLSKDNSGCMPRKGSVKRTSQQKQKSLPPEDLDALCQWLAGRGGKWNLLAAAWLQASVLTGLRPAEWREATLSNDARLRVKNAKNSQGRACGEWRELDLQGLDADELAIISHFLSHLIQLSNDEGAYKKAYNACRQRVEVLPMAKKGPAHKPPPYRQRRRNLPRAPSSRRRRNPPSMSHTNNILPSRRTRFRWSSIMPILPRVSEARPAGLLPLPARHQAMLRKSPVLGLLVWGLMALMKIIVW